MNEPSHQNKKLIKIIVLLISYLIVAVVVWKVTIRMQTSPKYQQEQAEKQVHMLLKKVGALTILPSEEIPQIAVIQDVSMLRKDQPFFTDAENGDSVIVYVQAKKAILYREKTNKIINIDTAGNAPVVNKTTEKKMVEEASTSTDVSDN